MEQKHLRIGQAIWSAIERRVCNNPNIKPISVDKEHMDSVVGDNLWTISDEDLKVALKNLLPDELLERMFE